MSIFDKGFVKFDSDVYIFIENSNRITDGAGDKFHQYNQTAYLP